MGESAVLHDISQASQRDIEHTEDFYDILKENIPSGLVKSASVAKDRVVSKLEVRQQCRVQELLAQGVSRDDAVRRAGEERAADEENSLVVLQHRIDTSANQIIR